MTTPQQLWAQYHMAVKANNMALAQSILRKIQSFTSFPQTKSGCSSCRRRM